MFRTSSQNFCVTLKTLCRPLENLELARRRSSHRTHQDNNSKILPKLVYLHNPWAYLQTKFQLFKLRLLWDKQFAQNEFIRGSKQSAIVVTNHIRDQDGMEISNYTTPVGFQQITRDMILSRKDIRLKLINFRVEDIKRAIPMKVSLIQRGENKNCLIDVVFVGMRNMRDFPDSQESMSIQQSLRQLDLEMNITGRVLDVPHRILFAEIYMRFYRDYSPNTIANWAVSFYKIISFDILNYDPK